MILTSNNSYGECAEVFSGDAVIAAAILNQLLHHSTTITIKGETYRLKDKRRAGLMKKGERVNNWEEASVSDRWRGVHFKPLLTDLPRRL